jgi:hypothetical protein
MNLMLKNLHTLVVAAVTSLMMALPAASWAQTTAFNYQGILNFEGQPVTGSYDFVFDLFPVEAGGTSLVGKLIPLNAVPVNEGRFYVLLDFGSNAFDGSPRWIAIAVRPTGVGAYSQLAPRQPVLAVPYAVAAQTAQTAVTAQTAQVAATTAPGAVTSSSIQDGTVTAAKIAPGQVVKSINGFSDTVTIAAGRNVTVTPSGNQLTISASGAGESAGGWGLSGNSGTTPGLNFIGTTDDQPLIIKAYKVGVNTDTPANELEVAGKIKATAYLGDGSALTGVNAELPAPFTLEELSYTPTRATAWGVAVAGDYAYVADGWEGLTIYDIGNPLAPSRAARLDIGKVGDVGAVCISGKYAYLGGPSGLGIVDVSSIPRLARLGDEEGDARVGYAESDTPHFRRITVSGNHAYAATGSGLLIYDVSDPTSPTLRSRRFDGERAYGVAVSGTYAYVANGGKGLGVYDVANPAEPVSVARVDPVGENGHAWCVAVSGQYAFVASDADGPGDRGLQIYNISNPNNPALVKRLTLPAEARSVAVQGNFVYLGTYGDGMRIIDVSDINDPKVVGHAPCDVNSNCFTEEIAVQGLFAYAARHGGGLAVYFAAPLAIVPGAVKATAFIGDGSTLTGLKAGQLTGRLPNALLAPVWQLGGNAGTEPGRDFLGTTDNRGLELRVGNEPVLHLTTDGSVAMGTCENTGVKSVALGYETLADNRYSTALGRKTRATGEASTAMGEGANASGTVSTAMGHRTSASGDYATAAGDGSIASGLASTALGKQTVASEMASFAAGNQANAVHSGSFVWADSQDFRFFSQKEDQFLIRAAGGVGINTAFPSDSLDVNGTVRATSFRSESDVSFSGTIYSGPIKASGNVQVSGDLHVQGNIRGNTAGVTWDQANREQNIHVLFQDIGQVIASKYQESQQASGFLVILATADMRIEAGHFIMDLCSERDGSTTVLASANVSTQVPLVNALTDTSVAISWVLHVEANTSRIIKLKVRGTGMATVRDRNLTLMFFPTPPSGQDPGGAVGGGGIGGL